jgi:acyl carrier protein
MERLIPCFAAAAVLIIALTPFVILSGRKIRRKNEEVFGGRQELDEREFYEKYFAEKGVPFYIVQKIRRILEEELAADLSRLSAADDFSKNLSFFWEFDSAADVEIATRIEDEFDIKILNEEATDFYRTVDGIVDFVWRKVRQKNELEN